MIPLKGYSTFDTLKHCIVGQVNAPEDVEDELKDIMYRTREDLNNLVKILESMDVVCHRPTIENKTQRPPISPRDYFVVFGEQLFVGNVIAGYKDIIKSIDREKIKWYLGNDISSCNMIRCGNHVHWDVSKDVEPIKEQEIMKWLQDNNYKVSVTRYGWHMDGMYSILKPGVMVARRGIPEIETIYPTWDICYLDDSEVQKPIEHEWGGDYTESNYDINILSVDTENCIVANEEPAMFRFLEKHKINPIVCRLRDRNFWDNGIHCVTQDLYREGKMEDYLQINTPD